MRRLAGIALLSLGGWAASSSAGAQDAPPIARWVPATPDPRHVFVTDSAHVLSDAAVRALQDSARALQASTGADVFWVTLPSLGGRRAGEAALYVGRTWKVGNAGAPGDAARNRGLVVLYVPDKATTAGANFRVEVGNGLEGTITDSRSRRISAAMRDDLKAKRYDDAYAKGWAAVALLVREDWSDRQRAGTAPVSMVAVDGPPAVAPVAPEAPPRTPPLVVTTIVALLIGLLLYMIVRMLRGRTPSAPPATPTIRLERTDDDDSSTAANIAALLAAEAMLDSTRRPRDSGFGGFDASDFGSGGSDSGSSDSGFDGGSAGGGGGFSGGGSDDTI